MRRPSATPTTSAGKNQAGQGFQRLHRSGFIYPCRLRRQPAGLLECGRPRFWIYHGWYRSLKAPISRIRQTTTGMAYTIWGATTSHLRWRRRVREGVLEGARGHGLPPHDHRCVHAAAERHRGEARRHVEDPRQEADRPVQHSVRPARERPQGCLDDRRSLLGHEQLSQRHRLFASSMGTRTWTSTTLLLTGQRWETFTTRTSCIRQAFLREDRHHEGRPDVHPAFAVQPVPIPGATRPITSRWSSARIRCLSDGRPGLLLEREQQAQA